MQKGVQPWRSRGYGKEHQYPRKNYFQFTQMAHIIHQLMTLNTRFHEAFLKAKNHPTLKKFWFDLVVVMQWLELDKQELERINSTRRQFRFAT